MAFFCLFTSCRKPTRRKQTLEDTQQKTVIYLPIPERSWTATTGEGGEMADVGQGVDKEDVPVSKPVEAEYDELIASSTDGLPFRKSLTRGQRREVGHVGAHNQISEYIIFKDFHHFSGSRLINTENKPQYIYC